MKHLISLVSKQTVPNVLFINEAKDVDNYVFIYTAQMENELHQITDAVRLPTDMLTLVCVEAFSLTDIIKKLSDLKFKKSDEYVVNITGGTKMMSLGAYQFFEKYKKTKMVYLGIGDNSYQEIFPKIKAKKTPLSYHMNIQEYLACHGFEVDGRKNNLVRPELYTRQMLFAFTHHKISKAGKKFIGQLRDKKWDKEKSILPEKVHPQGKSFLVEIGFISPKIKKINSKERHYLIGGWLEEYAYTEVKNKLGLSDEHLAHSVQIKEGKARNEIDVFFIHKNTPYAIECKTGLMGQHFSPAIYKQSAFRDKIGKDIRQILFSLSSYSHRETGEILDRFADRANQHDITLIDKNGLMKDGLKKYLKKL